MTPTLALVLFDHANDNDLLEESRLHLATLLKLALALESGEIGKRILNECLRETPTLTKLDPKKSSRL